MKIKLTPTKAAIAAIILFVISVTLALCLTFCKGNGEGENNTESENGVKNNESVVTSADYTYKTDISAIANALDTVDKAYLVLANKTNIIGEDHIPQGITAIDTQYTNGKSLSLAGNAAIAAEALVKEMRALGYDVFITSAYRSYDYQMNLFNSYINKEKEAHPDWSDKQIKELVLTYSAYPGTSEHQTGLCMDLMTKEMSGLWNFGSETPSNPYDKGFAETREYAWLLENAHKFGFILRYPENKTEITGYAYESWHYRFVGIDAATYMYENKLTLEEYLEK